MRRIIRKQPATCLIIMSYPLVDTIRRNVVATLLQGEPTYVTVASGLGVSDVTVLVPIAYILVIKVLTDTRKNDNKNSENI